MMTRQLLLIPMLILLALTGSMLWVTRGERPELQPAAGQPEVSQAQPAAIGGGFELTDQNGNAVKDSDFRGRLMLMFFGFTHCPDICPVTLATFTSVMNALGESGAQVAPVFISVDPERDTPERLKEYLADFHPSIVGLTGSRERTDAVVKAYKAYVSTPKDATGEYMVNHSSFMYLMGRNGEYLTHFSAEDSEKTMTETIRSYLR